MSLMTFFIIVASGLLLARIIYRISIKHTPVPPDPWENEISKAQLDRLENEICPHCGTAVKEGQYYCSKCGNATGRYVPYLPFVNIRFNYSMHQTLWRKLKSKEVSVLYKIAAILFITATAPIMIAAYSVLLILRIAGKITIKIFKYFSSNTTLQ